jgi:nucleotide-binding universal stress UspA family protein
MTEVAMFQRILLSLDSSETGQLALSLSIAVAHRHGSLVRVIHVNSYQSPGRGLTPETDEQAFAIVDRAVLGLLESGIDATGVAAVATCFGVADRIAAEAEDWGADAIVMGSARKGGVNRFLGQHIRRRVMALSNLPVLVAPAPLQLRRRGRSSTPEWSAGEVSPAL